MAPTIEYMVDEEFRHVNEFVQEILRDTQAGRWGACAVFADMWTKLDDQYRPAQDMEGYVMDRLTAWDCVGWGDRSTHVIDGTNRDVTTLYLKERGTELAEALAKVAEEK
jgi:hypothetical protein